MWKYITKRLLLCIVILLGVSVIVYTLVRMMPTDYIDQKFAPLLSTGQIKQADVVRIKKLYGLYAPDARVTIKFDKETKDTEIVKYDENIQDYINLEIAVKRFRGTLEKFFYNPISLTSDTVHYFPNLRTLHIYEKNDPVLKNKKIKYYYKHTEFVDKNQAQIFEGRKKYGT